MKIRLGRANPLSPFVLSTASVAFFVFCLLIPPQVYETLIPEQNLMFLDAHAFMFFMTCTLAFWLGMSLKFSRQKQTPFAHILNRRTIILPLLAAVTLNSISVTILFKNNPWMLLGWLSDSAQVKRDYDATGGLSEALPLLFAVCWWAHARTLHRRQALGTRDGFLSFAIIISAGFAIFTATMKAARFDLIPGILGFLMISNAYTLKKHSALTLLKQGLLLCSIIGVIFFAFAVLRGATDSVAAVESIAGYTAASYNRLSAVLEGRLVLPYEGSGGYSFTFLTHIPLLHNYFDVANALDMPSRADVRLSEFAAISNAGLDDRFIWVSAFGFLYSDIGFWTPLYLLVIGHFTGFAWRSLNRNGVFGIVLYPWTAFNILFWLGSNYIAYPRLITFSVSAILLFAWEKISTRPNESQSIDRKRWPPH